MSQTLRRTRLPEVLRPREPEPAEPLEGKNEEISADTAPDAPVPPPVTNVVQGAEPRAAEPAAPPTLTLTRAPLAPPQPPGAGEPVEATRPAAKVPPRQNITQFPQRRPPPTAHPGSLAKPMDTAPARTIGPNPPQHDAPRPGTLRISSNRPSTKRIDKTNARAARRHSIFVALMKGLLPGLVIGLAGVFFFYSYDFKPVALPDNVNFDPGEVSIGTDGIRMVAPKLTGVDNNQQTFEIKADEAIQDRADPTKVTLVGIDARVNLKDGGTIGFSAQKGVYNTDLNQIWLSESLEIRSSEGYVAQLSEAQVDFKNGQMVSNSPVLIFTNDGVINASGVQVLDGGNKVIFSGRVTLSLNGSVGETQ
ncbi:hypothetical protein MNBD_ALPHA09-864 [hydrothermal vent metagenome]|uniref:LPS export ABC transporter periplasmic protein LptC n=1 Tax=hydrothermal vent metagenome TaxID=652676 RepID=A0A3B0T8U6_9ZZZZ